MNKKNHGPCSPCAVGTVSQKLRMTRAAASSTLPDSNVARKGTIFFSLFFGGGVVCLAGLAVEVEVARVDRVVNPLVVAISHRYVVAAVLLSNWFF